LERPKNDEQGKQFPGHPQKTQNNIWMTDRINEFGFLFLHFHTMHRNSIFWLTMCIFLFAVAL